MKTDDDTHPRLSRRSVLYGATAATAALGLGSWLFAGSGTLPARHHGHPLVDRSGMTYAAGSTEYADTHRGAPRRVTRKSASRMSGAEIERFARAFEWAVARGFLDAFNDEHYDAMRNRHHGADVQAGAPPSVKLGETGAWGFRLLPWHRAFLLEAERMLRAALHDRNRRERRDPREADLLFLPYWDATHDRALPRWVERLRPRGGTAIVPPDLPRGHACYGKPVGSRYRIDFGRWPGNWLVFSTLPPPDQFGRIMARAEFPEFYAAIDQQPEMVPEAKQSLAALAQKIPNDPNLQVTLAAVDPSYPKTPELAVAALNAFLALGHRANVENAKPRPDRELIRLILSVHAAVRFPPHVVLHFFASGLDPRNPNVRGTVSYFNELCVDPAFWMLHGELDHVWHTWARTHASTPPLQGNDAVFQPLRPEEGTWYGGGRAYQLVDLAALPYDFDMPYTV